VGNPWAKFGLHEHLMGPATEVLLTKLSTTSRQNEAP